MIVSYTVVNGEILAERRDGVRKRYIPDPLGTTVAMTDSTGQITDTFKYWPFGEVRSRTGTTPTPFQFGGTLGYYRDTPSRTYARARVLQPAAGRWLTPDPLLSVTAEMQRLGPLRGPIPPVRMPSNPGRNTHAASKRFPMRSSNPYAYARNSPATWTDPSGLFVIPILPILIGLIGLAAAICLINTARLLHEGHQGHRGTNDKFDHCVVACGATKSCLISPAYLACMAAGRLLEFFNPGPDSEQDITATDRGCLECGALVTYLSARSAAATWSVGPTTRAGGHDHERAPDDPNRGSQRENVVESAGGVRTRFRCGGPLCGRLATQVLGGL